MIEIVEKYALNRCRRALSHNVKHIVDFLHNIIEQTDRTRLSDGIGKGTVEVSIVFYFHKVVLNMCKKSSRALSGFSELSLKMPARRLCRVLKYSSVGVLPEIVEKYALNRCRRALSHNVKHIVDFLHNIIEQTDRTSLSDGIGKGTVEVSIVFYFHKVVLNMCKKSSRALSGFSALSFRMLV